MAIPVLIIGKSGSGKSASMKSCVGKDFNVVRVLNKPLPFKGKINGWNSDDYQFIRKALKGAPAKSIVIDDAGYLITNFFMRNHSTKGKGNDVFGLYNQMADDFWRLIQDTVINELPPDKIVYIIMHEDTDDYGNIKAKTIGKLLDEKVCIEGQCTVVLRCVNNMTAVSYTHLDVYKRQGFGCCSSFAVYILLGQSINVPIHQGSIIMLPGNFIFPYSSGG